MPIYQVQWISGDMALVRARDDDDLELKLDEVGDTRAARWWIYNGPLWIGFKLPKVDKGNGAAVDLARLGKRLKRTFGRLLIPSLAGEDIGETGEAMAQKLSEWGHPELTRLNQRVFNYNVPADKLSELTTKAIEKDQKHREQEIDYDGKVAAEEAKHAPREEG